MKEPNTPKVFLSYSWTTPEHEANVVQFAQRLVDDGVDVVFDKWDLLAGQDVNKFMEQCVADPSIDKVIIVCDSGYARKADERKGGVGTEAQVISPEVYEKTEQVKYVPVVFEMTEEGKPCLPIFLKSRKYFNLCGDHKEEQYEQLLRHLFNRPEYTKPTMGKPPSYLFVAGTTNMKTTILVNNFEDALAKNAGNINDIKHRFLEAFMDNLPKFQLKATSTTIDTFGETILESLHEMLPLRNDVFRFMEIDVRNDKLNLDWYIKFFEQAYVFTLREPGSGTYYDCDQDNYKFFLREIFLFFVKTLLKYERYQVLDQLLNTTLFIWEKASESLKPDRYNIFNGHSAVLDQQVKHSEEGKTYISGSTHILVERRTDEHFTKLEIVEADLLLFYLGRLVHDVFWFPCSYIYKGYQNPPFFVRMRSKRFFEKVKPLFHVASAEELLSKCSAIEPSEYQGYSRSFDRIPSLVSMIGKNEIASMP